MAEGGDVYSRDARKGRGTGVYVWVMEEADVVLWEHVAKLLLADRRIVLVMGAVRSAQPLIVKNRHNHLLFIV